MTPDCSLSAVEGESRKRFTRILAIAIFAIGSLAVVTPVSAHFTLGDLTAVYTYHVNDFDSHVPEVIGYV